MAEQATDRKQAASELKMLRRLRADYEEYADADHQWRPIRVKHRDYYDNNQWESKAKKILEDRGEPVVVDNLVADKLNTMLGIEIQSRTDVRALPRNPGDQEGVDAATEALEFVDQNAELDGRFSDAAENQWIEGTGHLQHILKDAETGELGCDRLHPDQCYWKVTSRELDFRDNKVFGVSTWWHEEDAKHRWPGKKNARAIGASFRHQQDADVPRHLKWANADTSLIRVLETYWQRPDESWWYAVWTYGGFLRDGEVESPGESQYPDDRGRPYHPHVWQSTFINGEGRRYGLIERWLDLQDETNKRRSKGLHYLNTNQVHIEDEAWGEETSLHEFAEESKKPDGILRYRRNALVEGRARIDKNVELAAGNMNMLQDARNRLGMVGPGDNITGRGSNSGRHAQSQQQGELIPTSLPLDRHQSLKRRSYRMVWAHIKHFWTDSRWIRVMDGDEARFTPVNMGRDEFAQTPMGQEMVAKGDTLPEVMNPISDMDFDMILDEIPDVAALQQEVWAEILGLAEHGIVFPREAYLELAPLANKTRVRKLLKQLEEKEAESKQQQGEIQNQMLAKQIEQLTEEIKLLSASAAEKQASADLKAAQTQETQVDTTVRAIESGVVQ